jgi:hypothetical protein
MRLGLLLLSILTALPAHAILIRGDRDDAEYLELATRYPSSILLAPGIEAVVIAPRWLLASAAAARGLKERSVQAVYPHPQADLALILLREPTAAEPTPVYRGENEQGMGIAVAGHGETGVIGGPSRSSDGRKRAAINTIDRVDAATFAARIGPADDAPDLQGVATESERGAPAFVEIEGRIEVAGLRTRDSSPGWQDFVRLSHYVSWIDETMFRAAVEETRVRGRTPNSR